MLASVGSKFKANAVLICLTVIIHSACACAHACMHRDYILERLCTSGTIVACINDDRRPTYLYPAISP